MGTNKSSLTLFLVFNLSLMEDVQGRADDNPHNCVSFEKLKNDTYKMNNM